MDVPPLRLETAPYTPSDADVDDVVRHIRAWTAVTPQQRAAVRAAAATLSLTPTAPAPLPPVDRPLRVTEVAERLAVSRQHVRDLIKSGALRAIRLSGNPRSEYRVPESALAEFLDRARTA